MSAALGAELRDQVAAAIDAPSSGANSPSNQRFRRVVGHANRDVGVATRQVERLVGQDQFDHDARILRLKLGHDRRHEMLADRFGRGDGEFAGRLDVAASDPTLEFEDRLGHRGRQRDHFFAGRRRFVSRAGAVEEAGADRGLHRRQPPEHRRMIDAETFGRPDQRTGFRDRLDQSKFVPAQPCVHGSNDRSPLISADAVRGRLIASSLPFPGSDTHRIAQSFSRAPGARPRGGADR